MIAQAAALAELIPLAIAAWQDVKRREIDIVVIAAMYVPAAIALYYSFRPVYILSLGLGAILAAVMRATGSGYADSLAILALSLFPPPFIFLPTPAVIIIGTLIPLVGTALWLALANRGRPCKMTWSQRLTHICVRREEVLRHPYRYIVGDAEDLERYTPPREIEGEYVLAKYGAPYVAYLAVGYLLYLAFII